MQQAIGTALLQDVADARWIDRLAVEQQMAQSAECGVRQPFVDVSSA